MTSVSTQFYQKLQSFDYTAMADNAMKFMTAHTGCMLSPFVTAAVLGGATSPATDYTMSVMIGSASMLAMDHVVQKVKVDDCVRCVTSKLQGFKRQGKILTQAVLMSSAMFLGHSLTGHQHESTSDIRTDSEGRQFMLKHVTSCGKGSQIDTLWINTP